MDGGTLNRQTKKNHGARKPTALRLNSMAMDMAVTIAMPLGAVEFSRGPLDGTSLARVPLPEGMAVDIHLSAREDGSVSYRLSYTESAESTPMGQGQASLPSRGLRVHPGTELRDAHDGNWFRSRDRLGDFAAMLQGELRGIVRGVALTVRARIIARALMNAVPREIGTVWNVEPRDVPGGWRWSMQNGSAFFSVGIEAGDRPDLHVMVSVFKDDSIGIRYFADRELTQDVHFAGPRIFDDASPESVGEMGKGLDEVIRSALQEAEKAMETATDYEPA